MAKCTPRTIVKLSIFTYVIVFIYALTNYKSRILFSSPDFMFDDSNYFMISNESKRCRLKHSDLKDVQLNMDSSLKLEDIAKSNPELEPGGKWQPSDCEPWQKVMVIIPYRDREYHLRVLLNRIHPMLQKQKLAYQVFVAEQIGDGPFARGLLFNVAFLEAMKIQNFDCVVMHDVDLLPETDKNIYVCDSHARHLAPAIDEQRYHPIFNFYYGGVTALSVANYRLLNGYANRYFGWGNEDDDMSARTIGADLLLTRPPYHIGKYKMVRHLKASRSDHGYENFLQWRYWWKKDGLSNMASIKYKVLSITKNALYTNITIDAGPEPGPPRSDIPKESLLWFAWFYVP